jgi:hypothetical protein
MRSESVNSNVSGGTSNSKKLIILIFCLVIGFGLRFYAYDQKSLWIDEVHTFNDSRDDIYGQLKYYQDNPTYLHPPLFFVLTHLFHPFAKPERDLRIIPLIFGILSVPMMYLLSMQFSSNIAIPCTLSLTFMTYHIFFSQDGRMYSLILFCAMVCLYFFMRHIKTSQKRYLAFVAVGYATLFYTSYSSILFIIFSQTLWFFSTGDGQRKFTIPSFLMLNGLTLCFCAPWIAFLGLNYSGQPVMDPLTLQEIGPFSSVLEGILRDWASLTPLTVTSLILLIVLPFFLKPTQNSLILLGLLVFPVGALYSYCRLLGVTQFITSRYFISFLPVFIIALYYCLYAIELRFKRAEGFGWLRPKLLFLILFILSNSIVLLPYYRSEKQDFRGLVNYLDAHIRSGDRIVSGTFTYIPGILHYFNVLPVNRHYVIPFSWKDPRKLFEFKVSLISQERRFSIHHSNIPYKDYAEDGNRVWILVGKESAKIIKKSYPCVLKGYFDGSFANFRRFPSDASMYLFLWDPQSPGEKGIDMPVE